MICVLAPASSATGVRDWLLLTAYGTDENGNPLGASVDFYLADYRFADNTQDYVLNDWAYLDLSTLSGAAQLHFNLSSSDVGFFGMNTPAFFAVDDIAFVTAVPEPSAVAMLGLGLAGIAAAVRRRRKSIEATSAAECS